MTDQKFNVEEPYEGIPVCPTHKGTPHMVEDCDDCAQEWGAKASALSRQLQVVTSLSQSSQVNVDPMQVFMTRVTMFMDLMLTNRQRDMLDLEASVGAAVHQYVVDAAAERTKAKLFVPGRGV